MIKIFFGVGITLIMLIPMVNYAQEMCGNIITTEENETYVEPIEDCSSPFGPIQTNENLEIFFQGIQLVDGGVYQIAGQSGPIVIPEINPATFGTVYKHEGSDFVVVGYTFGESVTFTTGVYSIYVSEMNLEVVDSYRQRLKNFFVNTTYAASGDATLITFEVTEVIPEAQPVDPLILQYAPILYFHEDEDYFPMDVNSYVDVSALWYNSGIDTQIYASSSLTFGLFENLVASGVDTSDTYLAFSDPDTPGSINLENAKDTYQYIKQDKPTVYYHKMTDTTDYGRTFTVLQYWYFYAMNNWKEQGGRNDHEGDWESVFVFLANENATNLYPAYVAYSSHLNDGDPEGSIFQYDSVRREWGSDEVVKDNGRIVSFVAQGSHANYSNNGNGEHKVGSKFDKTSYDGKHMSPDLLIDIDSEDYLWDQYQGKWGTDTMYAGEDGPQGPRFTSPTFSGGVVRFENPIEWAGIDKIQEEVILDPVTTVSFDNAKVLLAFTDPVPSGTSISVTPYYEPVTFGIVPSGASMLPGYYDFNTNMEDGFFEVRMTLPYDAQYIESAGVAPQDIRFGFYNESIDTWEILPTIVDEQNHSVSTIRTGFSRYALMVVESEEIPNHEGGTATTTEQIALPAERSHHGGRRIRRDVPEPQVLGVSVSRTHVNELMSSVTLLIGEYPQMTYQEKQRVLQILNDIIILLKKYSEITEV